MGRASRPIPRSKVPLHRLIRSHPGVLRRWLVVMFLGGSTALMVVQTIAAADAARSAWGDTTPILVSTERIAAGEPVDGLVELREWPVALKPPGALDVVGQGAEAAVTIEPGLPITASAVLGPGSDAEPRVRVAVPLTAAAMAFTAGQRVDLWATTDRAFAVDPTSTRGQTRQVAVGATVDADSASGHLVVAVADHEVAAVVEALATATITPVLVG